MPTANVSSEGPSSAISRQGWGKTRVFFIQVNILKQHVTNQMDLIIIRYKQEMQTTLKNIK